MYHALLSDYFKVQTRITWRDGKASKLDQNTTWFNEIGDIWLATKTGDFVFNNAMVVDGKKYRIPVNLKIFPICGLNILLLDLEMKKVICRKHYSTKLSRPAVSN